MDKTPKLNLETPDFSKAELPLGEESVSVKIDPKLKLGSEPIGLAGNAYWQKLSEDVKKVYDNPIFGTFKQIEDDKKSLLGGLAGLSLGSATAQLKLEELGKALNTPSIASAFKSAQDYETFSKPLLGSIQRKDYKGLAESLATDYKHFLKPEYATTQSALEQFWKTLESPSIQNSISQLENLGVYESGLAKAAASIAQNEDLLKSSQRLNEIGKSILNDSFKQRMNEHNIANLRRNYIDTPPPPKNHLLEHTARITDQNDQLIETSKLQNDILKDIAEYMRMQSEYAELQNENIEYQIEQKESEIEGNKKSASLSFWIAVASIGISVIVSAMSWWATYDVYYKEDISGQKDHQELLQAIKESSNTANLAKELQYQKDVNAIQQQQMIRLNQEVEQMKAYLNSIKQ